MTCLHMLFALVFVSADGQAKSAQHLKTTLQCTVAIPLSSFFLVCTIPKLYTVPKKGPEPATCPLTHQTKDGLYNLTDIPKFT